MISLFSGATVQKDFITLRNTDGLFLSESSTQYHMHISESLELYKEMKIWIFHLLPQF